MKDKDYNKLIELTYVGGGFIPANDNAEILIDNCINGQILAFTEVTARDIKFHRCYMSLLGYIYDYLPLKFKKQVSKCNFYQFVKHCKGDYEIMFTFNDGRQMIEYKSISFGRMSQMEFKNYIKEQMPFIYTEIIGSFFKGKIYDNIIETIEKDYEKFFAKL
jgi:hypothetical protein